MGLPHRTERLASLIRAELARILLEEISDPSLKETRITRVEVTGDLKEANIYFSPDESGGATDDKQTLRGFSRATPFFKRKLGDNLDLRYIPSLKFRKDTKGASIQRIFEMLDELRP